jgi:hypothetical protein
MFEKSEGPSVERLTGFYFPLRAFGLMHRAQNS